MKIPSRETIEKIRQKYPKGTRVELVKMSDLQAPPAGTKGTVIDVDDVGSLIMAWDNGCGLNVLFQVDKVKKLDSVKVICCGKEEVWDSRKEAADFYLQAMAGSEGSERQRYTKIYTELLTGKPLCTDEE